VSTGLVGFVGLSLYPLLFFVGQSIIAHRVRVRKPESQGQVLLQPMVQLLGLLLLFPALTMMESVPAYTPLVVAGAVICLAGLYLSMWAQRKLGRNWVGGVGKHKNHKLVQGGPYRYVRHPLYSGMIVSALGLGLMGWNIVFAVSVLFIFGSLAMRIFAEELLLEKTFGKKWLAYKQSTGALFPKIRKGR